MALGSALNEGGGRSRNQRRHPATTPAPQTMSVDLYNHFRPLEQDVPQDHILPFLDFGRKLTTGPPLNSIESSSTTAKADPASASARKEEPKEDLYHEDMDVAAMRKAVERNTVPRRMVRLKDPVISAYFKKRANARAECESCRRDNNTEPDLQGHESRTKIHKVPLRENSTTPLKIVVTEKPRGNETSGPPPPDPTPKILSTAVVTSVSVRESPRAAASPSEEAAPETRNTTLESETPLRPSHESKNTSILLPPGPTSLEIEKSGRESDNDTTPKLPPDRPKAEPEPEDTTPKPLLSESTRKTAVGVRKSDDTTEKLSPVKSNAGIEPGGRGSDVTTPESLPGRSSTGAEPGSHKSENSTDKVPLGSLGSETDPGTIEPRNTTLKPTHGRSSVGTERGKRVNATLEPPPSPRPDAETESPSPATGEPENAAGKLPAGPSTVAAERANPKPEKVALKLPATLTSARRENQTHYSSLFNPNKAKLSTTPRPKPTFRPVTFRSAFTRRNFTKIMPPVIRVVSTPHSYIEVPKILKSLHTQAGPVPASTTTTTSSTTTAAPVTETTVGGTSERPETTFVTEEPETTTTRSRGPAETTTEETTTTTTSPRPTVGGKGESEEKGGGLEATAGPGLLWVYGRRNLTVLEGLRPVGVAYENTLGAATYVLAVLGIVPLLLGAFVLVRQLLKNKKKVLDESEYSSEYNRSPLPTKLPRLPAHLNWENEKPQVVPTLCKRWEFPREKMRLQTLLGQGNFGQVWKAEADDISGHEGQTRLVAVKMVKEGGTEREKEDLLRELGIMQDLGAHPNVVTLLGCCTEKEPYMLIMEYVMYGKLLAFLREHRTRAHYFNFSDLSSALTSRDLTVFAYCVARGMEYLVTKGIIHRDLAARNILVDHNKLCKIADFGMSRNVRDTGQIYEQRPNKGALPIRWMAPESLQFCLFTHKADVWSFGILLWEIITLGSTPYATMGAREVIRRVKEGYRLERPKHCKQELYKVVTKCWSYDPSKRPSFSELRQEIGVLLGDKETHGGFVDLDALAEEVSLQNN